MNREPATVTIPSVSTHFIEISHDQALSRPYKSAWLDPTIPHQQLALVRNELSQWFNGIPFKLFDTIVTALKFIPTPAPMPDYTPTVLEIGCGVGHYAPVVHKAGVYCYKGVDYSHDAIRLAREQWKDIKLNTDFVVDDATYLSSCGDQDYDIVLSSATLMHLINWKDALAEAARVARSHLILHRTPIARNRTRYFVKHAYGVPCLEIHFSEHDLFEEIYKAGFELSRSWKTSEDLDTTYKTYLLERSKR